jgi:cyclic pyranopterin phosphate synthase
MKKDAGTGADQGSGPAELSHVASAAGREQARMVDVGSKPVSERSALARARVRFPGRVLADVQRGAGAKGALSVIEEIARAAGTLAAKRTGELIPLCHPLGLDHVEIAFEVVSPDLLEIRCRAACRARTGVEMEALTGAALAALTVYDMTKALDPAIRVEGLELVEKRGGKRGVWRREAGPGQAG